MVMIVGSGKGQQALQQDVNICGIEEVVAANDLGNVLVGIVDDHGKVVGGADVAAGEHDVADPVNGVVAGQAVGALVQRTGFGDRLSKLRDASGNPG